MSTESGFVSREEVLGGLPARRASTLLFAIESRTAHLVVRARQAAARLLTEKTAEQQETAFLEALAQGREAPLQPTIQDLERYAPEWALLVPSEPAVRAAIARLLAGKYTFTRQDVPELRRALGLDDEPVRQAYERLHGQRLETIFAPRVRWSERLRWAQSGLARWLEELPPFWTVFALTLTETVGAGILALPIGLAQAGPLGGVALLLLLGLLNVLTITVLGETFSRNGNVRYRHVYFGGLAADYLGSGSASLASVLQTIVAVLLLALCITLLLAFSIGVSTTLAAVSGAPAEVWAGLMLLVLFYFLRRETLNATIASALVIGAINLGLILVLCALALTHLRPENLLNGNVAFARGRPLDPSLLSLLFGVVLAAYFGHFSTGTCARLVLSRDPGGAALLWGNIAAMSTAILVYSLWVIAVYGAVPAAALVNQSGTALVPLAAEVGPVVYTFGLVFVILGMGMTSIHFALAIFNQVREYLPSPSKPLVGVSIRTGADAWVRKVAGSRAARFWIGAAPVALIFGVSEWQLLNQQESFAAPLSLVGTLAVPALAGVFPVLMLASSRRKGEYVPKTVVAVLGHPLVLLGIYLVFVVGVLLHALVIWQQPIERLLALVVGLVLVGISLAVVRAGALIPRAALEIRVDSDQAQTIFGITVLGKPAAADLHLQYLDCERDLQVRNGTGQAPVGLRSATFHLPATAARELKVWTHRITTTGDSEELPARVELRGGRPVHPVEVPSPTGQVLLPLGGEPCEVEVRL